MARLVTTVATQVAGTVLVGLPQLVPRQSAAWLLKLVQASVEGLPGLPGAKHTAGRSLQRRQSVDQAMDWLTLSHIGLASAQGFVTNLGGGLASLVGLPANLVGVVVVQVRLAACIAHLRGYDVDDPRVRTALVMCLLGDKLVQRQIDAGQLPGVPLVVATAAVADSDLTDQVAQQALAGIMSQLGVKDLAGFLTGFALRRVPLLGGGVGAVVDAYATGRVARYAKDQFVSRRPLPPAPADRGGPSGHSDQSGQADDAPAERAA
ncbi:MAG: EcsC family protein [Propionibacteriaceae bacterium]|jgi:hypothetical protein|nr:EcsC family protein [Propionibacteriaceae bacterium]